MTGVWRPRIAIEGACGEPRRGLGYRVCYLANCAAVGDHHGWLFVAPGRPGRRIMEARRKSLSGYEVLTRIC